jgi:hypothetical protein
MMLMLRRVLLYALLLAAVPAGGRASADQVDVSAVGPRVGAVVPDFQGVDQFGARQTLQSTLGPKGAMLVFFRSADW